MERGFLSSDFWDDAVIEFCRTRYPLSVEPILVKTSTNELNDIYKKVSPDELHEAGVWLTINAIYRAGMVDCYAVGHEAPYGNARLLWRNPNTGEFFVPKEN